MRVQFSVSFEIIDTGNIVDIHKVVIKNVMLYKCLD